MATIGAKFSRFEEPVGFAVSKALYVVIHSRQQWWVDFEGKANGPFASLDEAAEEGRQLAKLAAHTGKPSELLVPDEYGQYRVAWTSENEPHAADYAITSAAE